MKSAKRYGKHIFSLRVIRFKRQKDFGSRIRADVTSGDNLNLEFFLTYEVLKTLSMTVMLWKPLYGLTFSLASRFLILLLCVNSTNCWICAVCKEALWPGTEEVCTRRKTGVWQAIVVITIVKAHASIKSEKRNKIMRCTLLERANGITICVYIS